MEESQRELHAELTEEDTEIEHELANHDSDSEEEEFEEELPLIRTYDHVNIQPYQFEPEFDEEEARAESQAETGVHEQEDIEQRLGNNSW